MSQMSLVNIRDIGSDALQQFAKGYEPQVGFVGDLLFPIIETPKRFGDIVVFGDEAYTVTDTRRAPGAVTKRMQISVSGEKYILEDRSLEAIVPVEIEEEMAFVVPQFVENSVAIVQDKMALEKEKVASVLATTAGNYPYANKTTLSGENQFSHANSSPFAVIDAGKEAVRSKSGRKPNIMVVAPKVLTVLRNHAKVLDRLSTASDRPPATLAQLAALFEVDQVVEGGAIEKVNGTSVDLWGKNILLAYSAPKTLAQRGSQTYGVTYQLMGRPIVEPAYIERSIKSAVYPVSDAWQRVLVGNTSGYLVSAAVA